MRKTTKKLKTTRKNTISNTIEKEKGGRGGVQFTRSSTKGEEQHQGRLKNTKKSTKKLKTIREKTINNTTKKEWGG
jgi:hypothetical protein